MNGKRELVLPDLFANSGEPDKLMFPVGYIPQHDELRRLRYRCTCNSQQQPRVCP